MVVFPSLYGSIPTRTNAAFFLFGPKWLCDKQKASKQVLIMHTACPRWQVIDFSTSSDLENHICIAQNQLELLLTALFGDLRCRRVISVLEHATICEVPIVFCCSHPPGLKPWGSWSFAIFHRCSLCWCPWCCHVTSWLRIALSCPYRWFPESPVLSFEVAA